MRRRDASPRAGGDEGAMAALLPRVEPIELLARPLAPAVLAIVDVSGRLCELTGETRARVERAVGPIVCACSLCTWHGPLCTPSCVENPWRLVSSRRNAILSSMKSQLSQVDPPPAPADVIQVPFSTWLPLPTGMSGITPFSPAGSVRTTGLKFTFTSLSAKSCSLRNCTSAG